MNRPDPSLFVIALSAEVSGHLAVAVLEHLRACKRLRLATPPELPDLVRELANRATRGQDGSPLSDLWQVRQASGMSSKLVSYADAATVLGVSPTTVKRLVRSGDLTPIHLLGSARLRVCDIDEYIERLAQNASTPNPMEVA